MFSAVSQEYYIYVASESDDTVSLIKFDGKNLVEIDRINVGFIYTEIEGPHGITVDPNGKFWYVTLSHGNPFGKLVKYSTENNEVIGSTELGLFPASMQISSITGMIYCVNFNLHGSMKPSSVSVVDPETMTEITKIKTGVMPHGSRLSKDGLYQYSVTMMSGELFEIDALKLNVNRVLNLGTHHSSMQEDRLNKMPMMHSKVTPTWVVPHPTEDYVYIAANGSNEIIEVDLKSWEVSNRIKTGDGPYNVEVSPNGNYILATIKKEGTTSIWDLKNKKRIKEIKNSTDIPHGIAITPDSKYAFVSVEGIGGEPGKVDVISLTNFDLVSSIEIGKQAGGIAFWKRIN